MNTYHSMNVNYESSHQRNVIQGTTTTTRPASSPIAVPSSPLSYHWANKNKQHKKTWSDCSFNTSSRTASTLGESFSSDISGQKSGEEPEECGRLTTTAAAVGQQQTVVSSLSPTLSCWRTRILNNITKRQKKKASEKPDLFDDAGWRMIIIPEDDHHEDPRHHRSTLPPPCAVTTTMRATSTTTSTTLSEDKDYRAELLMDDFRSLNKELLSRRNRGDTMDGRRDDEDDLSLASTGSDSSDEEVYDECWYQYC